MENRTGGFRVKNQVDRASTCPAGIGKRPVFSIRKSDSAKLSQKHLELQDYSLPVDRDYPVVSTRLIKNPGVESAI